ISAPARARSMRLPTRARHGPASPSICRRSRRSRRWWSKTRPVTSPAREVAVVPVLVRLPPLLINLFPTAQARVELDVGSVGEMIDALEARWPGMRDRLCDSTPAIRRHINVFVDGRRATLATALEPGVDVFVLTAISGG